jgi:hypothetical protein
MAEEKSEAHNISLYPQDWRDVEKVAEQSGVRSISAALRIILQEWRQIRAMVYELESRNGNHKAAQPDPTPTM